jgi:hypothetical protein
MLNVLEIWILCVAAHCIGDFLLQTDRIAHGKGKPGILLMHAAIHGGLVYIFLQQWTLWALPLAVLLVHGLIDFVKVQLGSNGPVAFAVDQLLHLGSLWMLAWIVTLGFGPEDQLNTILLRDWILLGAGFTAAVWGVGHFIRTVAEDLCANNEGLREELKHGLKNGGATIGKLERALIFILIGVGQPAGIGFLVAAKSVLRFEEAKKQPLAEYVLIGTLWSFSLAIAIAYLTLNVLS